MRIGRAGLLFHDLRRLGPARGRRVRYRNVRHLDIAIAGELILLLPTMGVALPILAARAASCIIHNHLRFERLVDDVGVAAGSATAYVDVSCALLTVSVLLKCAARATSRHHVGLVRVRHVIVFLLSESLAAVRRDGPARGAIDHATTVAGVGQRVIGCTLIVHRFILGSSEASMNTLAYNLIKRAAHLLLRRLVVVDHALSVRFARSPEIVLIVAAVACTL